MGEKSHYK